MDMPIIPAHRRLMQENCKFQASLGYVAIPCLKKGEESWVIWVL
jgi:hypothetical protein